jgi:octaheme c-type cytochrome (tetrathionate reductase family)
MKKIVIGLFLLMSIVLLVISTLTTKNVEQTPVARLKELYSQRRTSSADHAKFDVLKKKFVRPQEVTSACISCHTERHKEVMKTSHWNWEREEYIEGKGIRSVGKKNILNNYCIGITGSEQSCNKCHIGYGWGDQKFDFTDARNVDCLACHDNSNTYVKKSGGAGYPDSSVDLSFVARRVGLPLRTNCGTCHFFGGGGNNVKHGDLEQTLFDPERAVDVHMATEGVNMQCTACHTADKHQMRGKLYSISSMNRNRSTCEQCHGNLPHDDKILNEHTMKVACQTCHIPSYAKVNPTKLEWDWSTAGRLRDGEPYEVKDSLGDDVYMSIKGSFVWGRKLKPEYVWFNGTASHYLIGDTINPSGSVKLNTLFGSYDDPDAKIIPVKINRTKQIYDTVEHILIQPKLFASHKGEGGYWMDFDWDRASREGMRLVGQPYSGKYGFVATEMVWPINHMVSPKTESIECTECHTRNNSRLANLSGFYMPGRDSWSPVEILGTGAILCTFAGVFVHASVRIFIRRRSKKKEGA